MKYVCTLTLVTSAFCCATPALAVVTFDWATVGNPGNLPDTRPMNDGTNGYGGVGYTYRISKYEVTNAQYSEFLNAVDPTGANLLALYSPNMSSNALGGINFDGGAPEGSKYVVKPGRDSNPVIFVSYFDAMRFVNWLDNGQASGTTESGAYVIDNGTNEIRDPKATFFLPSEDEWFKAAYHKNNGASGDYWLYATSTDVQPYSDEPPGDDTPDRTNTANITLNDGLRNGFNDGHAVDSSTSYDVNQNYLTDVGAYFESISPYGTFDQSGSVFEWTEGTYISLPVPAISTRILRGGAWLDSACYMWALDRCASEPSRENYAWGFRVASAIPEPATACLWSVANLAVMMRRTR